MTNRERLISHVGFAPANQNAVEGALIDLGIDGNLPYDASNQLPIKKAAIQVMRVLLTTADTQNENTYQITFDRDNVIANIKMLEAEIEGATDSQPYITSRPVW